MFFIIENQTRADGIVNTTTTARENLNSALSYYHERFSKMSMTDLYPSVALLLVDENLNKIDHAIVRTMYPVPVEEADEVAE